MNDDAALLAHDVRNALLLAALMVERLERGGRAAGIELTAIRSAIDYASALCRCAGGDRRGLADSSLCELVAQLATLVGAADRRVRVIEAVERDADLGDAFGPLLRAGMNVGLNAARALKHADVPTILLRARASEERVELTIRDNGPGVPAPVRHVLSERSGDAGVSALGQGLLSARRALRGLGGELALTRSSAQGAEFKLSLPLREAAPVAGPAISPAWALPRR